MKQFFILVVFLVLPSLLISQSQSFPCQNLLTPAGDKVIAGNIRPDGGPLLVVFWNTNSNECCEQMEAMVTARDEYLKDYQVKLVSIYVADASQLSRIRPLIAGKDWDVECYLDVNAAVSREMCIPQLPYTILYDPHMNKVCAHIGFCAGAEDLICEKVKQCMNGMH